MPSSVHTSAIVILLPQGRPTLSGPQERRLKGDNPCPFGPWVLRTLVFVSLASLLFQLLANKDAAYVRLHLQPIADHRAPPTHSTLPAGAWDCGSDWLSVGSLCVITLCFLWRRSAHPHECGTWINTICGITLFQLTFTHSCTTTNSRSLLLCQDRRPGNSSRKLARVPLAETEVDE